MPERPAWNPPRTPLTAPVTTCGAIYVTPSPFGDGGFTPDSDLGASSNILLENSRRGADPEGESGQPDAPEGSGRSRHAILTNRLMERLIDWRKCQGLEQTALAVAAAVAAARHDLPGNGRKWEVISGSTWDDDEFGQEIRYVGARSFDAYRKI